jgi:uncharacterized membrane protein
MPNPKVKQLHQTVIDTIIKVKEINENHNPDEPEELTFSEKFADITFGIVSSWISLFLFALFITGWIIYNISVPEKYSFDPYPFLLMTFLLAGIAAIQAPLIMITQHRQNEKNNRRIALNLKVENEILSLHQSITVLIEQQLQQVHENQLTTLKLLQELQSKTVK